MLHLLALPTVELSEKVQQLPWECWFSQPTIIYSHKNVVSHILLCQEMKTKNLKAPAYYAIYTNDAHLSISLHEKTFSDDPHFRSITMSDQCQTSQEYLWESEFDFAHSHQRLRGILTESGRDGLKLFPFGILSS